MIILLDVMFIFLFVLVLTPEKSGYNVEIAQYLNIPNTIIVAKEISKKKYFVYEKNRWRDLTFLDIPILKNSVVYSEKREIYKTLPNFSESGNYKIKTYVYGELFSYISKKVFSECRVNDNCKNGINFYIKKDGTIDTKK